MKKILYVYLLLSCSLGYVEIKAAKIQFINDSELDNACLVIRLTKNQTWEPYITMTSKTQTITTASDEFDIILRCPQGEGGSGWYKVHDRSQYKITQFKGHTPSFDGRIRIQLNITEVPNALPAN